MSILRTNLLYLASLALLITLGALAQAANFALGLAATELLLVLLPALLFVWLQKLPLGDTLRWHWVGWKPVLLGALVGAGLWLVSPLLGMVSTFIFGYLPPDPMVMPETLSGKALVAFSLVILAPLCEEIFFRGVVLRSYDRLGMGRAVLFVGLMFVFYHMRLSGFLQLVPIALALGYLARRSGSIFPAVSAHFITNLVSGLLVFAGVGGAETSFSSLPPAQMAAALAGMLCLAGVGGALAVAALWFFDRTTPAQAAETQEAVEVVEKPGMAWLRWLPLVGAALIFIYAAGVEFLAMRFPEALARRAPVYGNAPWQAPFNLEYRVLNRPGGEVGKAACALAPSQEVVKLDCRVDHQAYDVSIGQSRYLSDAYRLEYSFSWEREGLGLVEARSDYRDENSSIQPQIYTVGRKDGALSLEVTSNGQTFEPLPLPGGVVFRSDLPWKLAALDLERERFRIYRLQMAFPESYDPQTQKSRPAVETATLEIMGAETTSLNGESVRATRVVLIYQSSGSRQKETFWYALEAPHNLVKYDNGVEVYELVNTK